MSEDRESELLERWRQERSIYDAWGAFVLEEIRLALESFISLEELSTFFKVPLSHRVKDETSLLTKAFHRGKKYSNPYEDIEDKVGGRVVVLFLEDIRVVEKVIKDSKHWLAHLARDFEVEKMLRPYEFNYQSLHYVLRSKEDAPRFGGVEILSDIPCEIQIRTLLQHAYSELTHDTIYKPSVQAEPDVKRAAAKSMALIEATDDYFTQVRRLLDKALAPSKEIHGLTIAAYRKHVNVAPEVSPLNALLIDHYRNWATSDFAVQLSSFLDDKQYIIEFVQERAAKDLLYRQPAILLVYYVVKHAPRAAAMGSPLTPDELRPIYGDLGETLRD